jgi:methionine-gamma-lyase
MNNVESGFNTKLIHTGEIDDQYGSATVPIYQTSTFSFENAENGAACFSGDSDGYIYTRIGNPTINALERQMAALENGYGAIAVSSGMAAATTIYLSLLSTGDHIVSTDALYGPARSVMEKQSELIEHRKTQRKSVNFSNSTPKLPGLNIPVCNRIRNSN